MSITKEQLSAMSTLVSRMRLAHGLGLTHDDRRDVYHTLGYKKEEPLYTEYLSRYLREDIARRIVDAPPKATWRNPPLVTVPDDGQWDRFVKRVRLWHMMERWDRMLGLGRYGVMMIGTRDAGQMEDPVQNIDSLDDILYLAVYSEFNARIAKLDGDPSSPRFGLPEIYEVAITSDLVGMGATITDPDFRSRTVRVHHSRILHAAEGLLEDNIFGIPRLKPVYNRLDDIQKVVGGSAEMFWLGARQGMNVNVDADAELDPEDEAAMEEQMQAYSDQLTRYIKTKGADVKPLAGQRVDPRGPFEVIMALISAATGIPQRVLTGSEMGQLASDQDSSHFVQMIQERQAEFAEPCMIRPFVERLAGWGILSAEADVTWPSAHTLDDGERAEIMRKESRAIRDLQDINPEAARRMADEFERRWFASEG